MHPQVYLFEIGIYWFIEEVHYGSRKITVSSRARMLSEENRRYLNDSSKQTRHDLYTRTEVKWYAVS